MFFFFFSRRSVVEFFVRLRRGARSLANAAAPRLETASVLDAVEARRGGPLLLRPASAERGDLSKKPRRRDSERLHGRSTGRGVAATYAEFARRGDRTTDRSPERAQALAHKEAGRRAHAEAHARKALARLGDREAGPGGSLRAGVLATIGELCATSGRFAEAAGLFERALNIRQAAADASPSARRRRVARRSKFRRDVPERARATLRAKTPRVRRPRRSPSDALAQLRAGTALTNLATVRHARGDDDGACDLLRKSAALKQTVLGAGDPRVAKALLRLAAVLAGDGPVAGLSPARSPGREALRKRRDEAAALRREAKAILADHLGSDHASVVRVDSQLARAEAAC